MNIAMVSLNTDPPARRWAVEAASGSAAVDGLSNALNAAGHAVTVYAQSGFPSFSERRTTVPGVRVEYVDAGAARDPAGVIAAVRELLVKRWGDAVPDVVHAHSLAAGKAVAAVASSLGVPFVQTFAGRGRSRDGRPAPGDSSVISRAEETALLRAAARVVATSSAQVFELLEMGVPPRAIKLVPGGVDLGRFVPGERRVVASDGLLRLATLSSLDSPAGVADVIEAVAHVGGIALTVGGGLSRIGEPDSEVSALEALAEARGIRDRIVFAGRIARDDVAAFLRAADVVVCVPWYDATGTVALEAMACGIPVIASAVGGHVDAVAEGISGLQVPPRSPRQLAYAIDALKTDMARRERFGRFGAERASARYGWTRIAADMLGIYRSLCARDILASRQA